MIGTHQVLCNGGGLSNVEMFFEAFSQVSFCFSHDSYYILKFLTILSFVILIKRILIKKSVNDHFHKSVLKIYIGIRENNKLIQNNNSMMKVAILFVCIHS